MPDLTFVLPHWLYWGGLVLFPLIAMAMLRRNARNGGDNTVAERGTSIGIGYFLLVTAGFIGMHRVYLRNLWGLLFVPLFIGLLLANVENRASRDGISIANNDIAKTHFFIEQAHKDIANAEPGGAEQLAEHTVALAQAQQELATAHANQDKWIGIVRACALAILAGLIFDLFRIPALKRRCEQLDAAAQPRHQADFAGASATAGGAIATENTMFARAVGRLNDFSGTFVAYWSVIAVFVYYYEVIARYVFNSPTNWAHESMFLMFGAQYLLAGGFCLRENAHVRVDVFYTKFSARRKAMVDVATSVFFFIFMISLLTSGWTFFQDSLQVGEVSFTEWGIQYYPIKLSIALGAALLLLQGVVRLLNDIATLRGAGDVPGNDMGNIMGTSHGA